MARVDDKTSVEAAFALEKAVADALADAGWSVEKQPVLGTVRPDLLVESPQGDQIIVEVKAGKAPVHFGVIAQLAAYPKLAESVRHLRGVRSALMTTAPLSRAAEDASEQLGVLVFEGAARAAPEESPDLDAIAQRWAHALTKEAEGGEDATLTGDPPATSSPDVAAPRLSHLQKAALADAAAAYRWSYEDLVLLLDAVFGEWGAPALPQRLGLTSAHDWVRFHEQLLAEIHEEGES
ncbi:MAG TPA: hypothetical protein VFU94_10250 [Conexibacter sp.]|nr:hypothetical protein [Conexibacter sp.]